MDPDISQTSQVPQSAGLPPVSAASPQSPPGHFPVSGDAGSVAQQAEALVNQYGQDPYHLQAALQQLKTQYLAEQFHITINSAEE